MIIEEDVGITKVTDVDKDEDLGTDKDLGKDNDPKDLGLDRRCFLLIRVPALYCVRCLSQ